MVQPTLLGERRKHSHCPNIKQTYATGKEKGERAERMGCNEAGYTYLKGYICQKKL